MNILYVTENDGIFAFLLAQLKANRLTDYWAEYDQNNAICLLPKQCLVWDEPNKLLKSSPWTIAALPVVPTVWSKKCRNAHTHEVLNRLKQRVRQTTYLIHCGTPNAYGQHDVDQVLATLPAPHTNVFRLWLTSLDPLTLATEQKRMQSNEQYAHLSDQLQYRSQIDWLCAVNFSRYYSIRYAQNVYINRIGVAILAWLMDAHTDVYDLTQKVVISAKIDGFPVRATLDALPPHYSPASLRHWLQSQPLTITEKIPTPKSVPPPYPLNALEIQNLAHRRYNLTLAASQAALQSLYRYGLISCPDATGKQIPVHVWQQAKSLITTLAPQLNLNLNELPQLNFLVPHRCFVPSPQNPAIYPTACLDSQPLSADEFILYRIVCNHFISLFLPDYHYNSVQITYTLDWLKLTTHVQDVIEWGWKTILGQIEKKCHPIKRIGTKSIAYDVSLATTPQKAVTYTEAQLCSQIHTLFSHTIDCPKIIQALRDRNYIANQGKTVIITHKGRHVYQMLVPQLTDIAEIQKVEQLLQNKPAYAYQYYKDFLTDIITTLQLSPTN